MSEVKKHQTFLLPPSISGYWAGLAPVTTRPQNRPSAPRASEVKSLFLSISINDFIIIVIECPQILEGKNRSLEQDPEILEACLLPWPSSSCCWHGPWPYVICSFPHCTADVCSFISTNQIIMGECSPAGLFFHSSFFYVQRH